MLNLVGPSHPYGLEAFEVTGIAKESTRMERFQFGQDRTSLFSHVTATDLGRAVP